MEPKFVETQLRQFALIALGSLKFLSAKYKNLIARKSESGIKLITWSYMKSGLITSI